MSPSPPAALSEVGVLRRVVVKHARDAFASQEAIDAQWRSLNFSSAPDFSRAAAEYDRFVELVASGGAEIHFLPKNSSAGLDSIYVRDASVLSDRGVILCGMGKPQRAWEPGVQGLSLLGWQIPVLGEIRKPGRLEGGDVVWLDPKTVVVGRGYRTNDDGIRQFRAMLGDSVDEFIVVPLPHWRGPGDVFHLMSILSPVAPDLAVVYSKLMPVPLRETLVHRGMELIEVPDEEVESMGANVLALGPRRCVMVAGSPRTRRLLEQADVEVLVYVGDEISHKGGGGPTCLTRPIERVAT